MSTSLEERIKISNSSSRTVSTKNKNRYPDSIQLSTQQTMGKWMGSVWHFYQHGTTYQIGLSVKVAYHTLSEVLFGHNFPGCEHPKLISCARDPQGQKIDSKTQQASKIFALTVYNALKVTQSRPAVRQSHQKSYWINDWRCSRFFPPDFSKFFWQFFWCQRVSVWLQGMCFQSNIWGLIINIKTILKRRRSKHDRKMVITKLTGFCHENIVTSEKKILGVYLMGLRESCDFPFSISLFLTLSSLCLLFFLEILFPLVIGVSQILFPMATLWLESASWICILLGISKSAISVGYYITCFKWHSRGSNRNYNLIFLSLVSHNHGDSLSPLPTSRCYERMETRGREGVPHQKPLLHES